MHVEVNNARLWIEDEGDGPTVLFLHGGLGDSRLWAPVAHALADEFRCVRYDLRFYGRSEGPPEEWSTVDDVVGVLDTLGIDRAALVGLSLGGGIAIDVALAQPQRVWAVAHVAGGISGRPLELDPEQEARYAAAEGDLDAEMAVDFEIWAPLGAEDFYRELWLATPDARGLPEGASPLPRPAAELDRLTVPVLAITAHHDPPALQQLAHAIPNAEVVDVDSDHYLTLREPELVTRLLRDFLARTTAAR